MRLLLLAILLAFGQEGHAADGYLARPDPCYWSGRYVRCYPTAGLDLSKVGQGIKLPTEGGAPSVLDYYENGTFILNFTGARTTPSTIWFTRVGSMVTIATNDNINASCTAANTFNASGQLPTNLTPASTNVSGLIAVQDNGTTQTTPGQLEIQTDSDLIITKSFASNNFTNGANCGWFHFAFTYPIN